MSHAVKMVLGCLLPLLVIFVLPLFGVSGGASLFVFIVLMFACHLLMMRGHADGQSHHPTERSFQGDHHAQP